MGSITVWERMLFLTRDNLYQGVCFSYRSLAASVGFVTTVAEDAAFCCAAHGHMLRQLPPFPTATLPVHPNADLLSPRRSSPAPLLPSEGGHRCQVGHPFPTLSSRTPTVAPQNFGWQWLLRFKLSNCPEQVMLWWCALPLPSGVVAAFNGC